MLITSIENSHIKEYIKLKQKKYRDRENKFIIEGEHLVREAFKYGLIEELILEVGTEFKLDVETTYYLTPELMKKISSVESPQPVMALCKKKIGKLDNYKKILLLDNIQDPGNLGTIIRSAVAFNIDTIVLGKESVDLYNPKVVRATEGMLFHINIIRDDLESVITKLKEEKITIYSTSVSNGYDVKEINKKDTFALIVGNEGSGVRKEIENLADVNLYIKMNMNTESLNVAVATSILLYELGS